MRVSKFSLWELFPIGAPVNRTNPHHRKAGPGRRHNPSKRRNSYGDPVFRQRLAPALGIGDWKGERYLSYHAHDAQRRWKGQHEPGTVGPGEYLRRVCGIDTEWMDEADIYLRFLGIMRRLAERSARPCSPSTSKPIHDSLSGEFQ